MQHLKRVVSTGECVHSHPINTHLRSPKDPFIGNHPTAPVPDKTRSLGKAALVLPGKAINLGEGSWRKFPKIFSLVTTQQRKWICKSQEPREAGAIFLQTCLPIAKSRKLSSPHLGSRLALVVPELICRRFRYCSRVTWWTFVCPAGDCRLPRENAGGRIEVGGGSAEDLGSKLKPELQLDAG